MDARADFSKRGGILSLNITTPYSKCELLPEHGAHILSFTPVGHDDLLWLSSLASFDPSTAVRGGIPICWPWFGDDKPEETLPKHGFARTAEWILERVEIAGTNEVEVAMSLSPSDWTRSMWPYEFKLDYTIVVGRTLRATLTTTNKGDVPFGLSQALHTYFRVGNIAKTAVEGLDGVEYLDALDDFTRKRQKGDIVFAENVDSVYVGSEGDRFIRDDALNRRIKISKEGSFSDVVWNPWTEKAAEMSDFDNDGYTRMVCVETANAFDDKRTVAPGDSVSITMEINVDKTGTAEKNNG